MPIQIRTGGGVTFYRATRGRLVTPGATTQELHQLLPAGHLAGGPADDRPGVRYERQYLEGTGSVGDFPAPLCHDDDTRPGAGDGSGAAIACNFTWNNLAPRIGATFDLTGDGRAKVFASWGRFYAQDPERPRGARDVGRHRHHSPELSWTPV